MYIDIRTPIPDMSGLGFRQGERTPEGSGLDMRVVGGLREKQVWTSRRRIQKTHTVYICIFQSNHPVSEFVLSKLTAYYSEQNQN